MPVPSLHLTEKQQRVYNLGNQLLDVDRPIKYTIVDFLLNERLRNLARNILDFWTLSMSHHLTVYSGP